MIEIVDEYTWIKDTQIITQDRHRIPGLKNFTHQHTNAGIPPKELHYHTNILELHCMIKGRRVTVLEQDGQSVTHVIHGNEAFIVFPFEVHSNGEQPQPPSEFYAMQIDVTDRDHLLCLDKEYSNALCDSLLALKHRHIQISNTEIRLLRTAFNLFSGGNPDEIRNGVLYLSCFLSTLCYLSQSEKRNIHVSTISPKIQTVLDYVKDNITRAITLEELAEVSGYSLSHFKTLFKEEVGTTPNDYILQQKLQLAKHLLVTTDITITELSYSIGFSSSNYFSSVFRKLTGCTPTEYRAENGDYHRKIV
ncbi:MAG: AraC family transcriptional regulator [Lachnospiraceae bacterium]|nr:AraC family transcriptional regulator [Lachnospiraceae bacterium]